MINEIHKAKAELVEFLTKFQEKHNATHDELKQAVEYALDDIKSPPLTTVAPEPEPKKADKKHSSSPAADRK